jgi:glycosyltransferase involved in cell wall biosynthesis
VQSLGLALALAERGERVHFVAQTGSALAARLASSGLSWESMPLRGFKQIGMCSWLRLSNRFRRLQPDIVHVHDSAAQIPALWAAGRWTAGRRSRRKPRVVVTRRTDFPLRSARRPISYELLSDRVICVSSAVRQRLIEVEVPAERLAVIPDFVDCRHFDPAATQHRAGDAPTIVAIGRLSREKGHAVLLRAMLAVARSCPGARLVLAGQGEQRSALEAQAAAAGISPIVEFLGFVPDVRPVLAAADVFAMPSLSEGLGVAALEAMAMAKPVVATNVGGLPESVAGGETGLIVPAGDADALAEALVALLSDRERARVMGEAGRQRALTTFDRGPIVDRIIALYQEVLSET